MAKAFGTTCTGVVHEVGPTVKVPGLTLIDHTFEVPLDHSGSMSGTIKVFAREVRASSKAEDASLPCLVYLQGGPGFESPRPDAAGAKLTNIQGTFREHSGNIQGIFREHSTFREHSELLLRSFFTRFYEFIRVFILVHNNTLIKALI
jgi:hypothetical protein